MTPTMVKQVIRKQTAPNGKHINVFDLLRKCFFLQLIQAITIIQFLLH